jgi:heat shock protein HtpX
VSDDIAVNRGRTARLVMEVAGPAFLVVLAVAALVAGPVVGLVLALAVGAAIGAYIWRAGAGIVRRELGGRPADEVRDARLVNLVEGIGAANGVGVPNVLVVEDPAPNALTFGLDARNATIALTTGLLERLSRVELEGVVARELARIKRHEIQPATVAVAALRVVGPIRPWADHVRRLATGATSLVLADAYGARFTRYPPGLADALSRLGTDGRDVRAGSPAMAHLWLEPPTSTLSAHPSLEERVEALREL